MPTTDNSGNVASWQVFALYLIMFGFGSSFNCNRYFVRHDGPELQGVWPFVYLIDFKPIYTHSYKCTHRVRSGAMWLWVLFGWYASYSLPRADKNKLFEWSNFVEGKNTQNNKGWCPVDSGGNTVISKHYGFGGGKSLPAWYARKVLKWIYDSDLNFHILIICPA